MRIRTVVVVVLLAFAFFIGNEFYYPPEWNDFGVGMDRSEIVRIAGAPTYDMGEIKGAFWRRSGLLTTHEMNIYFEAGVAKFVVIERKIGTESTFHRSIVYSTFRVQ